MELDFTGNTLADIAVTVAGIVALSLALQTAAGSTLMYVVEAIKKAFPAVDDGKAGLVAIILGMALGGVFGLLTNVVSGDGFGELTVAYVATGFIAGLFMGAGAIQNYKAAATVNPQTDFVTSTTTHASADFEIDAGPNTQTLTLTSNPDRASRFRAEHFSTLKPAKDTGENLEALIEAGPDEDDVGCDCTPNKA